MCEALSPYEARGSYGYTDGQEETQHFPCCVWPSRIGVRADRTAARPSVTGAMNIPVLGDHPAALVCNDGASIGMPIRYPSADHLPCGIRHFGLLENTVAVGRMHDGIAIAMENDRRYRRSGRTNCF